MDGFPFTIVENEDIPEGMIGLISNGMLQLYLNTPSGKVIPVNDQVGYRTLAKLAGSLLTPTDPQEAEQ